MTLIVGWIAKDTRGITSTYLASDSRLSMNATNLYDYGRKLYASKKYPDIFGYCGDVLFPSMMLSQLISLIDDNIISYESNKSDIVLKQIRIQIKSYVNLIQENFNIYHFYKELEEFHFKRYSWSAKDKQLTCSDVSFGQNYIVDGSGKEEFDNLFKKSYNISDSAGTSRNIYQCFVHTIFNNTKYSFGGAPQLVGIYRKPTGVGENLGIIYKKQLYYLGSPIDKDGALDNIEWRNENFERCAGNSMNILPNAQRQPNPILKKGSQ